MAIVDSVLALEDWMGYSVNMHRRFSFATVLVAVLFGALLLGLAGVDIYAWVLVLLFSSPDFLIVPLALGIIVLLMGLVVGRLLYDEFVHDYEKFRYSQGKTVWKNKK